ncbi:MAG: MFS transporter [Dehalococcoidia bacterium]|nr:MFS transporter [Dehalococcoidia bacterium]
MAVSSPSGKHFYGYTIVAACFFMQAVSVGSMISYSVFFKHLLDEFGWSRAFISGASSVVMFTMGAMGILFGRLNDRIGPRRILLISGLCLAGGFTLMSVLQTGWQLYIFYGLMVGIGMSSHDIVTLSTIARWFRKRRGMMTGLVKAGTGTGQFFVPLMASVLIAAIGWRHTYAVIGLMVLTVYLLAARLVKRSPEELGLTPDGFASNGDISAQTSGVLLGQALRTPQFWLCCLSYFCVVFGAMTILTHIVMHSTDSGMTEGLAAAVVSTIGVLSIAGRVTIGTLSDRIGSRKSFLLCFCIFIAALLWLQVAVSPWMLFAFAVVYGFAHGGFYTVLSPTIAELFGLRAHGAIFGIAYFWGTLGGALGPVVAGRIYDVQQSYVPAFWLLAALAALGMIFMLGVRPVVRPGE